MGLEYCNEWEQSLIDKIRESKRQWKLGNRNNSEREMEDARSLLRQDIQDIPCETE